MADADTRNLSDAHTARTPLEGRKAVITGGTTGIGRAIGILLASYGAEIFTCGRTQAHLDDALERMNEVGKAGGIACDVSDPEQLDRFFAQADETLGDWDIAVVNAAVPAEGVTDMSEDEMRYAIATDFTAYLVSAHKAVAKLKDKGDIVLIGSYSTHKLGPGSTVYAGCKAGVHGFAEALRREVSDDGIKVSLVVPALTGSDFQYPDIPADEQREKIKAEEMLRAEDIAVAVHFALTQPRRAVIQEMVVMQRQTDA
jgi:NADP-dependent 3-hydroxy acid dehydrogenase YdfG